MMLKSKFISSPRIYSLSWDQENCSIVLRVHEYSYGIAKPIPDEDIKLLSETHSFKYFSRDLGFDGALTCLRGNGFVELRGKIPEINREEVCDNCEGSGHDKFFNWPCFYCTDGKRIVVKNLRLAYALSVSLKLHLDSLSEVKVGDPSLPQLMKIFLTTGGVKKTWNIGGLLTPHAARWFPRRGAKKEFFEPVFSLHDSFEAMESAYQRMNKFNRNHRFTADYTIFSRRLTFQVPGESATLRNLPAESGLENGHKLRSFDVSSVIQQLTLLAGLAAFHDQVAKAVDVSK